MRIPFLLAWLAYALLLNLALARAGLRSRPAAAGGGQHRARRRVLIVGASGGTGRQLVAQALDRGLEVTALVRKRSRLPLEHARLTVVEGDVLDEACVAAAVRGQDAVLCALGHKRFLGPTRILSQGTDNLLRAMEALGIPRLVCQTSLGIGDSAGRMGIAFSLFVIPVILPFYFWDKTRQERRIERSALEWVIVRPAALTNGAASGRVRHGPGVGSFLLTRRISRADVAAFMLDQLGSGAPLRVVKNVDARVR
jgi:putative NADH-flavin reductase